MIAAMQQKNTSLRWTLAIVAGTALGLGLLPEAAGCLLETAELVQFGELVANAGAFTLLH
jgi:hypothetical protein